MMNNRITELFSCVKYTPLHPQWHTLRHDHSLRRLIRKTCSGNVLDVGCGRQEPAGALKANEAWYIGLDNHDTGKRLYGSQPSVFSDAHSLPFPDDSMDYVLILDVLEHLASPETCLVESARVLRPGGKIIVQVPFIYPVHDKPYDYQRWTVHGLRQLSGRLGFSIESEEWFGEPAETSALLFNIALSKTVLNCIKNNNPIAVLLLLMPVLIPVSNILGWLVGRITPGDDFMPCALRLVLVKGHQTT